MRRKDKERDANFAWQVLKEAPYSVLSMVKADGVPYCVPINHVVDDEKRVLYFHCASAGEKLDAIQENHSICLTAVSYVSSVPHHLTTDFRSAVVQGKAVFVEEKEEIHHALCLLTETLDPVSLEGLGERMERIHCMHGVKIIKILPEEITGKESVEPV